MIVNLELDQEIAEKVMQIAPRLSWEILNHDETGTAIGFEREAAAIKWLDEHPYMKREHHVGTWKHWPLYSSDIAAAFEVVAKVDAFTFILKRFGGTVEDAVVWNAEFLSPDAIAVGFTAPEAICRAALLAVAHKTPEAGRGDSAVSTASSLQHNPK